MCNSGLKMVDGTGGIAQAASDMNAASLQSKVFEGMSVSPLDSSRQSACQAASSCDIACCCMAVRYLYQTRSQCDGAAA